ncbi:hypothetical protein BFP72_00405 [Reichenbachiella sp. 5M10]|uniref:RagB/SusD family nutrient uptake outer membrane protein n=1 Tax=Reichenbachiella sp. 5M10 TaxID=1889772 RepID=UPI000C150B87|nr:RagB/SusD family nutrient uptake outer membrane protein [Reichenbachiella sp. 5M10]PIB33999.1 hypothetical protein BFP72_00405 [Reichenbachiella sp. 5M10]
MKTLISKLSLVILFGLSASACMSDLDTVPLNEQTINSATIFDTPEGYKQFLAKLYGSMTLTGQRGEFGLPEISAGDEGTTSFMRVYWSAQEMSTDEAITAWNDPGLINFHYQNWSDNNLYIKLLYQRIFINISYCNEYLREVDKRIDGLSGDLLADVKGYRAEAVTLRALYYYYAMDLWGNVPFITDQDDVGAFMPDQVSREFLFEFIETELLDVIPDLMDPGTNEYARIDKAMAYTLLAKMYLNAEVYIGEDRYTDCLTYANLVINSGQYTLVDDYSNLFKADNHRQRDEIIFPIAEDGDNTRNYGGLTFIIHGAVGGSMDADNDYGIAAGGWSGHRMTSSFVEESFADVTGETDSRAIFHTDGQELEINNPVLFNQGYLCGKFKNLTSYGDKGKNTNFVDTDFPLFRLADVYLIYAEAVLRGGTGGDLATALAYINDIRERAYGDSSGDITSADLDLDFILDERGRELYWEGHRRTDLIRFGQFSGGTKTWDWKGGVKEGVATSDHYDLFPIPAFDLGLNTNLEQNPEY